MTDRELWQNIMFYKGHDRIPVIHWTEWPETRERWIKEGMPADVDEHKYFQTIPMWAWIGINVGLYPAFSNEILEETEEYKIFRDGEGVIQKAWKHRSNIPHYIDFTFKTAKDWDTYKKKLQPDPDRIPPNIDEIIKNAETSELPVIFGTGSMMGWTRNWLGVENLAYFMYDHQDVFVDIVNTLSDLTCWAIDHVFPKMKIKPDIGFGWEDICGRSGPFVSPNIFKKCVAPGYRKIRNKLESYGTRLLGIDSDGDVKALLGEWLDAGVNVQFPIEIGTWNADPMEYRKKYGKELRIIGGFNKLVLEKTHKEIDEEIERRIPIMKEGGFIVLPDHLITPDTSLANYKYYLARIRNLRF
ncbi:MAG: uroporphyrinogen decarboxylase family protein [Candidatus Omnitrophica bacterium]|nr:uroporphyrinogen decarboxylase family protein [Candidatus Omnitrophota bacterium]